MTFKKLVCSILITHYGLQTLKVSFDLEMLVYFVVETPWKYPEFCFLQIEINILCPEYQLYFL